MKKLTKLLLTTGIVGSLGIFGNVKGQNYPALNIEMPLEEIIRTHPDKKYIKFDNQEFYNLSIEYEDSIKVSYLLDIKTNKKFPDSVVKILKYEAIFRDKKLENVTKDSRINELRIIMKDSLLDGRIEEVCLEDYFVGEAYHLINSSSIRGYEKTKEFNSTMDLFINTLVSSYANKKICPAFKLELYKNKKVSP